MKVDNYLFGLARNILLKTSICLGSLLLIILVLLLTLKMDIVVEATGKISPISYSILYSPCEEKIVYKNFSNNDFVKKGHLLIVFDTLDIKNDINIIENDILISKKRILAQEIELNNDLEIQESNKINLSYDLKNEIINYKLLLSNYVPSLTATQLFGLNIDELKTDEIKNNLVLLQKSNTISKIKNSIKNLENNIKQILTKKNNLCIDEIEIINKSKRLELLQKEFKNRFIYADFDGIITSDNNNQYNEKVFKKGEPILQIHNPQWEIYAQIPEERLSDLRENQKVNIRIYAFNYLQYDSFNGILESISNKNNSSNTSTEGGRIYYEAKIKINDARIKNLSIKKDASVNIRIITDNDVMLNVLKKEIREKGKNIL